ncbi:scavenger receptor class A member 5-like, partial [Pyrgilauda ruficollis]|uniref:scavenger receptor class A member 5-like n=1 Tax=Pyrgilauda ruficollis TaxID=221976 RepID=UPI001B882E5C
MESKAVDLHTFSERENGSELEEPFEGRSLSKLNLCEDDPGRRTRPWARGGRMGSVAALKYSVVGLYLLVLLILVGIFILAGEAGPENFPEIPRNSQAGR